MYRSVFAKATTSTLDHFCKGPLKEALDKASKGRTTIVIAHRLSTIRNADVIIGFASGKVVEQGPHDELIKINNGVYANLYNMQNFETNNDEADKIAVEKQVSRKSLESKPSRKLSLTDKENEEEKEEIEEQPMASIYGLNRPELCYNITGSITALIVGAIQPLFGIIFAEILNAYGEYACAYDKDIADLVEEVRENITLGLDPPLAGTVPVYDEIDQGRVLLFIT